jgi:hypothetical protein
MCVRAVCNNWFSDRAERPFGLRLRFLSKTFPNSPLERIAQSSRRHVRVDDVRGTSLGSAVEKMSSEPRRPQNDKGARRVTSWYLVANRLPRRERSSSTTDGKTRFAPNGNYVRYHPGRPVVLNRRDINPTQVRHKISTGKGKIKKLLNNTFFSNKTVLLSPRSRRRNTSKFVSIYIHLNDTVQLLFIFSMTGQCSIL